MSRVIYQCKKCGHKDAFIWHDTCPICHLGTSKAHCSDCLYSGHFKEFLEGGCPKCAGMAILAGEGAKYDEKLPDILGYGSFFLVFIILFIAILFIDRSLYGSLQPSVDNTLPWYFWFSFAVAIVTGLAVRFKLNNKYKIKQKTREIEARDKRMKIFTVDGAYIKQDPNQLKTIEGQMIIESTGNIDSIIRKAVMTPVEMADSEKMRNKIRDVLEELPIIEEESISEIRQMMIHQAGSVHPLMYSGSFGETVDFVFRMIQETEDYILSCKGIINVEKALLISDWPIGKPVLEVQYEQFWDNHTSNIYSEHVMRTGSDQYEVFGSQKSYARMKAIWKKGATVLCQRCGSEIDRGKKGCPKC